MFVDEFCCIVVAWLCQVLDYSSVKRPPGFFMAARRVMVRRCKVWRFVGASPVSRHHQPSYDLRMPICGAEAID